MPRINDFECTNLLQAQRYLKMHIERGRAYVIGDIPKECRIEQRLSGYCKFIDKEPIAQVGDFKIDFDILTKDQEEKCVEIIM